MSDTTASPGGPFGLLPTTAASPAAGDDGDMARSTAFRRISHKAFVWATGSAAIVPALGLAGMIAVLLVEALPAIKYNGFGFFTKSVWDVGSLYGGVVHTGGVAHLAGAQYGAWPLILGTIESSALALLIALPIAIGSAILVVERLPARPAAVIGLCLEILAGIPSVVYGLWGVLVLGPFLVTHVYPTLNKIPIGIFQGNIGHGEGLLTAGIVLAIMIVPIVAATTRDLLRQVPTATKEGAEALGMTRREAYWTVQSRWIRAGVIGAAVLGLGRALGETIAIAMISGSIFGRPGNIFGQFSTIAAQIVNQLDSALIDPSKLAVRTLAELALVLFAITLIVNLAARVLVRRVSKSAALPVGAGF